MGGLTLLDARQTKTEGGLNDGDRAFGAPEVRTVIGGEWDTPFLQDLTLTGRVTFTGNQAIAGALEGMTIPSWTVVDLGARYVFDSPWTNKPITVRFNVDNVFGENYWSTAYYDLLFLGAPRTYRLSTSFKF
jgi:iron complex outermembrane receptor protein